MRAARSQFGRGGGNQGGDLTATLLSAWAYQGSGQTRRALELIGRLDDQNFGVFRKLSPGFDRRGGRSQ